MGAKDDVLELDARFTFDTFVIGTANRLAVAAARRVAESPGASYNPLFIYSASGLGKTHLVNAIGHDVQRLHGDLPMVYDAVERFTSAVTSAIEAGDWDAFRSRLGTLGLLILDDVQFLAGRHGTQEELLRVWDAITASGGQVVLTSDRPPQEIDGLDDRLLSRFSGGLIVDIGAPDYETRVAIVRRKAAERGHELRAGVAESLARVVFGNVRELQGALNRLIAVEEFEGRPVAADDVVALLGAGAGRNGRDEFREFLAEVADTVTEVVAGASAERRLADAILRWEGEGYRTRRLEGGLADPTAYEAVEAVIRGFEADVERLREIAGEISALDADAPELGRRDVLRDPDRLADAEALLARVRERMRPLPGPPPGYTFEQLSLPADLLAVRAAVAAAEQPGERYNPLYICGPPGAGRTALLACLAERLSRGDADALVAFVDGAAFAAELIDALERNQVEGWRERYRRARALLVDDVDALAGTERAQEELFHLFESLHRAGAQIAFTASRTPDELEGLEERLRTRLESGLVVELPAATADGIIAAELETPVSAARGEAEAAAAPESHPAGGGSSADGPAAADAPPGPDPWFLSREKVVWDWPYPDDRLVHDDE